MSRKTIMIAAGAGLGAILSFGLLFSYIVGGSTTDQQLKSALSILDQGRWDVAGRIARDLEPLVDPGADAAWHYVSGVAQIKSIEDDLSTPNSRRTLNAAIEHLEQANEIGLPAGYKGKGKYYLGWCYFHAYQWKEAIDQLENMPMLWPAKRSHAFHMIVVAQLRHTPPEFASAETSLGEWKQIPGMSESELAKINLAEAEIAYLRDDNASCEEHLLEIPEAVIEYFDALVWRGRWRLEKATDKGTDNSLAQKLLNEAEGILQIAKRSADTPKHLHRQATYLSGRTFNAQGRVNEALGTFNGIRQADPQSAEAIASGIEEAEILTAQGDLATANTTGRFILRSIEDLSLFDEQWITAPELRRRLLDIGRAMRDQGAYSEAVRMAENIAIAFPMYESLRLQGEVYEKWGSEIEASLAGTPLDSNMRERRRVREKYLAAAESFELLSRLQLRSPTYTDILWQAIINYQSANNLEKANELLQDYLKYVDRNKRPLGYLALGKNHMDYGEWAAAIDPLQRCLDEYGDDHPVCVDARLLAARAKIELNQLDEAVQLLEENLWGVNVKLRPENKAWRDSLFELGNVIFRQGDQLILDVRLNPNADWSERLTKLEESQKFFMQAITRLGEAYSRWQQDPRHFDTRYLFARAHRLAAEMHTQLVEANPDLIESARRKHWSARRELLEAALLEYRDLYRSINQSLEARRISPRNDSLVRNCYFGEADTLYDLGRWNEALQVYQKVTARFMNEPESLEALLQMVQCYKKLGRLKEAKQTLNTAQQTLARIPDTFDAHFIKVTRGSRQEWANTINMM